MEAQQAEEGPGGQFSEEVEPQSEAAQAQSYQAEPGSNQSADCARFF